MKSQARLTVPIPAYRLILNRLQERQELNLR
jgi:hypothetical protein